MDLSINTKLNSNNVSFGVKLGPNVKRIIFEEFGHNEKRMDQFIKQFENIFKKFDENTVIDINKKNYFVLSHENFPKIKQNCQYPLEPIKNSIGEGLNMSCPTYMKPCEHDMLRKIVIKLVNEGKSFEDIRKLAEMLHSTEAKEYFTEYVRFAELIKKETPITKLPKKIKLQDMINKELEILDAEMYFPGTWANKSVHHLYN